MTSSLRQRHRRLATRDTTDPTPPARTRRPHGPRRWHLWTGIAFTAALIGSSATPALAHSELTASTPKDGASVADLDGPVTLEFVEPISPRNATVVLSAPAGDNHARGEPEVDGKTVTQQIEPPDDAGVYRVSYRVVAEDGHSITGKISFRVTSPSASPDEPDAVAPAPEADHDEGAPGPGANAMPERTADNGPSFPLLAVVAAGTPLLIIAGGVAAARARRARRSMNSG